MTDPFLAGYRETVIIKSIPRVIQYANLMNDRVPVSRNMAGLDAFAVLRYRVWSAAAHLRLSNLKQTFPSGICGYRACMSRDPISVKHALLGHGEDVEAAMISRRLRSATASNNMESDMVHTTETYEKRAVIPHISLSDSIVRTVFLDSNRRVHSLGNPLLEEPSTWTLAEIRIFVDKFAMYPKQFRKIATFLPDKSEPSIIDFYYKNKFVLDLKVFSLNPGSVDGKKRKDSGSNRHISDLSQRMSNFVGFGDVVDSNMFRIAPLLSNPDAEILERKEHNSHSVRTSQIQCILSLQTLTKPYVPPDVESRQGTRLNQLPHQVYAIPLGY